MTKKLLAPLLAAIALQAQAQVAGLQRCPTLEDPAARLACYDALLPPTVPGPRGPAAQKAPAPVPAAAPTATAAAVPLPAQAGKPSDAEATFGLAERRRAAEVQTIESSTGPSFVEWGPNERIRLENGQVWQVTDGSRGTLVQVPSKVTVRKGLLGAYFMEFQGMNRSPKVERVQ